LEGFAILLGTRLQSSGRSSKACILFSCRAAGTANATGLCSGRLISMDASLRQRIFANMKMVGTGEQRLVLEQAGRSEHGEGA
jgi:hypothetical protein